MPKVKERERERERELTKDERHAADMGTADLFLMIVKAIFNPPPPAPPPLLIHWLLWCMRVLAGMCDGAHKLDGAGFNKMDTQFGHMLAHLPIERWTPGRAAVARTLAIRYRRQLVAAMMASGVNEVDAIEWMGRLGRMTIPESWQAPAAPASPVLPTLTTVTVRAAHYPPSTTSRDHLIHTDASDEVPSLSARGLTYEAARARLIQQLRERHLTGRLIIRRNQNGEAATARRESEDLNRGA